MNNWLLLVTTLPTENATVRQRAWRALKSSGAAVLRDGVYLMPEREACTAALAAVANEVREGGGTAWVMRTEAPDGLDPVALFDRSGDHASLLAELMQAHAELSAHNLADTTKLARKLRKAFGALVDIDFFPDEAQRQTQAALQRLELALARTLSPDEPHDANGNAADITPRNPADFSGCVWATRRRPWVDRLACAWLIRRFIDPQAQLLWLDSVADCPAGALGFDFDGATFSHTAGLVSFEVMVASFGLSPSPLSPLARLGQLVHHLDAGGVQPPEAAGVEAVLAGLRSAIADDDDLLASACGVFDGLLSSFSLQGKTV
ncbi:MAG: chromate resistance protein [Burkholderiaceae bacterium]|nr:chromate resistance protein [Burkholderiaceae bacterium]